MPLQQSDVCSVNFIVDLYTTIVIFSFNQYSSKETTLDALLCCSVCVIMAERENVIALKGLAPAGQLPMGVLTEGKEGISSVCNMELDVTNYLSSSPPTAIVDLKDKIGSFDDASMIVLMSACHLKDTLWSACPARLTVPWT